MKGAAAFYLPDGLRQRLDLAYHLLQHGRACLHVAGPAGSGRSTFVALLAGRGEAAGWCVVRLGGGEGEGRAAALGRLARALGISEDGGEAALRRAVEARLEALGQGRGVVLVVLDDAHAAPRETVDLLLALYRSPRAGALRLVLAGPPELVADGVPGVAGALEAAVTHTVELLPWGEEEVRGYLAHRLGRDPEEALVRRALRRGGGMPGRIEAMLGGSDEERKGGRGPAALPRRVWLLAGGGVLVAAALVLTLVGGDEEQAGTRPLPVPPQPAAPRAEPPAAEPPARADREPPGPVPTEAAGPPPTAEVGPPPSAGAEPPPPIEGAAGAPPGAKATAGPAAAEAPPPAAGEPPAAPAEGAQATAAAPAEQAPPPAGGQVHDEAWVLARPAGHYTLQLAGARAREALLREAARLGGAAPAAVVRLRRAGADWYVLLYGEFRDHAAAVQARARLPQRLRAAGPWPRRFGELQAAIRAAR
ncbi:AAA family ATPase [Inmirania thermothiophila]|uniref:Type II secretion system protein A n=1 Tax=Inmirania thermothiophila TaxID=1750597 RepID=A0A3N1Y5M4_9GAMM|nr:AAA family ATPase [Inmirania thermothiophila]ROR34115.1 type II secretion system protein A [Inmirania thermothiophila]